MSMVLHTRTPVGLPAGGLTLRLASYVHYRPSTENTTPTSMIPKVAARIGLSPLLNLDLGSNGSAAAFWLVLGSIQSLSSHRSTLRSPLTRLPSADSSSSLNSS